MALNSVSQLDPNYAVLKSGGQTGAAVLSGGNDSERPGTPTVGMVRYNNQATPTVIEYYNGTQWVDLLPSIETLAPLP